MLRRSYRSRIGNPPVRLALLFTIACGLLSGCATAPHGNGFSPAPAPAPGLASVYVYRLNTPPILRKPDIEINGILLAELPTNSYTVVHVPQGTYEIKTNWGIFDGSILNRSEKFSVIPGGSYYVEISNTMSWIGSYRSWISVQALSEPPASIHACTLAPANPVKVQPQ